MTTGSVIPGPTGRIALVSATKVQVTGAFDEVTFYVARMELDFVQVPEPAVPLRMLVGAGILALFGASRVRR